MSEPVDKNIFLKTKIKSYCDEDTVKMDSNHTCLAVVNLDSALKKKKKKKN